MEIQERVIGRVRNSARFMPHVVLFLFFLGMVLDGLVFVELSMLMVGLALGAILAYSVSIGQGSLCFSCVWGILLLGISLIMFQNSEYHDYVVAMRSVIALQVGVASALSIARKNSCEESREIMKGRDGQGYSETKDGSVNGTQQQ